jgi:predicted heme/steroid binding protein
MSKSTIGFSVIIVVLLIVSGAGIWALNNRQAPQGSERMTEQPKTFTMNEVAQHDTRKDCWAVINGDVYNLTDFVISHPGGNEILRACGIDATTLFNSRRTADGESVGSGTPHSQKAREQLTQLKIGTLTNK